MTYKCVECGNIFEEGEQARWSESRGEFWGEPCYETVSGCPVCGGNYEKTKSCFGCGEEMLEHELENGFCEECREAYRYDVDMCHKIGSHEKESVSINCFLASVFSAEDIEEILFEVLKKAEKVDCQKFIEENPDWFFEMLEKEVTE